VKEECFHHQRWTLQLLCSHGSASGFTVIGERDEELGPALGRKTTEFFTPSHSRARLEVVRRNRGIFIIIGELPAHEYSVENQLWIGIDRSVIVAARNGGFDLRQWKIA